MVRAIANTPHQNEPPADEREAVMSRAEAAEFLNVGLPYLNRLLDEGSLPSIGTDEGRVVRRADVVAYRRGRDAQRRAHLEELVRLSEEAGMDGVDYAAIIRRDFDT